MAGARWQTSVKLAGAELPDCFAQATISAAAKTTYNRRKADPKDLRRLADKAAKLTKEPT